jgi:hypothetical protein
MGKPLLARAGLPDVCFQTKNPNLGKLWRVLQWKMLVYFMDTWSILRSFGIHILWTFGIVRGNLVYFPPFWYFVPRKIWQPWVHVLWRCGKKWKLDFFSLISSFDVC